MKDQRKKAVEGTEDTQVLEQGRPDVASNDDTQRVRTLTIQEVERLVEDKKRDS